MRVCLFEDRHVLQLEPLIWTRPTYELLCGMTSLGQKQWRYFAPCEQASLIRSYLAPLQRLLHPQTVVNDLDWLKEGTTVLVNSRWIPPSEQVQNLDGSFVATVDDEVAYAVLEPEQLDNVTLNTLDAELDQWKYTLPTREVGGKMIHYLWDLVDENPEQIQHDYEQQQYSTERVWRPGVATVGPPELLYSDPSAMIDPMVVADTTNGPVIIDQDAVITAFTRLEGPCYIGPKTQVHGAKIRAGTSLGPQCRIGGEVEESIVQGYSNKYHEGFLGHAYVGEWVNLGAGTHNSDLRNDYGEVSMTVHGQRINSGRRKVGCYLGDHTKSALGSLLNTGTNVGVFSNLLPMAGLLPKYVPAFSSVWNGHLRENTEMDQLLETAELVMSRRDCELTLAHRELYRELLALTTQERHRAFTEAKQRQLRRSA